MFARGSVFEQSACDWLVGQNYRIIRRNYHSPRGEVDIIALDKDNTLCFIEVRYREKMHFGGAIASISRAKQQRIISTALHFQTAFAQYRSYNVRFDVIVYEGEKRTFIPNAFD